MIRSMTGFGSARTKSDSFSVQVQVKAVNGRFLDVKFKMPSEYSEIEAELRREISKVVNRGTIDVWIYRVKEPTSDSRIEIKPNFELARAWKRACFAVMSDLNLPDQMLGALGDTLPRDVLQLQDAQCLEIPEKEMVLNCLALALQACLNEKTREGEALFKNLSENLSQLDGILKGIEKDQVNIQKEFQNKFKAKLTLIASEVKLDPQRFAQEVLFLTEKADIDEEIERARTHLSAYRNVLKEKTSVGKKLDFYTQELHREFNTMGSKAQSLGVILGAIEAKTIIERLREQVQNVE